MVVAVALGAVAPGAHHEDVGASAASVAEVHQEGAVVSVVVSVAVVVEVRREGEAASVVVAAAAVVVTAAHSLQMCSRRCTSLPMLSYSLCFLCLYLTLSDVLRSVMTRSLYSTLELQKRGKYGYSRGIALSLTTSSC